tara:strand:+ start:2818 stop:3732 length:915 start_codon:yes stop_codon:yes gene_type:complete
MDLYGASISQGNALANQARQVNEAAVDFNAGLASQLDAAKEQDDADASEKSAINMFKGSTSGAKLLTDTKARGAVLDKIGQLTGRSKLLGTPAEVEPALGAGRAFPGGSTETLRPVGTTATEETALRLNAPVETVAGATGGAAPAAAPAAAAAGEEAAEAGGAEASGFKFGVESSADLAPVAEEIGATDLAKTGLAGVGGGLDIYKDISRGNFGSNWEQKLGNVGNIAGSALEIGGALTAWTGLGAGAEALGALLSVGSTALETAGDVREGKQTEQDTEADITSQQRGTSAAAQQVTQAVGRSN